jgi:hypothetical protein
MSGSTGAPPLGAWGSALAGVLGRAAPSGLETRLWIEPGLVTARVRSERRGTHRLRTRLLAMGAPAWDAVVAALTAEPALLGALLDGELPDAVVEAAGGAAALVPQRRELMVTCSCGAPPDRCPFAGAAWWEVAVAADRAPATLLTLRGRSPEQLLTALRRLTAQRDRDADDGLDAAAAYGAASAELPPAPPVSSEPPRQPASDWTPRDRPPMVAALGLLVADAAARARDLRAGRGDGGLQLSEEADLARRAARLERDSSLLLMAELTGVTAHGLVEMGRAWQRGGADRVDVIHGRWAPPVEALTVARKLLSAHGPVTVRGNRVCLDRQRLELRLGRDGLWYLVDVSRDTADLTQAPDEDPAALVAARLGYVPRVLEAPRPTEPAGEQLRLL